MNCKTMQVASFLFDLLYESHSGYKVRHECSREVFGLTTSFICVCLVKTIQRRVNLATRYISMFAIPTTWIAKREYIRQKEKH